ncbi:hypothetical protein HanRHA438_Chr00c08g0847411 [Helianthus annuus]|nr:hypothetical protein HanRHA438_Chr00c08g0847411 [Helianthus annuus]
MSTSHHGIEVAVEFKPVDRPIEPLDLDQPVPCPLPEPSILNVSAHHTSFLAYVYKQLIYIILFGGGGGYSTVLPTAEVIPPRRPPPSKPESGGKSATVGALGTSKTRTRHLRVRMRAGGHWADTQWLSI